jgi:exodeoxyribonuclease VII large subunit
MPLDERPGSAREILTPTALNQLVRDLLEDALPRIWIEGELSNVARPASGHLYFTLKDAGAQVRCAMFKPKSTWLKFRPEAGTQVLIRGRVSLYAPRGDYQLIVDHMEESGEGALRRAFEQLKSRLQAEGLFDEARKRPLPRFPRRIGVITSASGAAIHDVLSVLARRFALADVEVLPVPVQGREAPPAIESMLRRAAASGRYDVLLLTRGGGSLEDLMAFNDEAVARAVHASAVPVVSAVGHEVDFSIADFVADLRAPTPSAAAELLVPDSRELLEHLQRQLERLRLLQQRRLQHHAQALDQAMTRLQAQRPQQRLVQGSERLKALHARLVRCIRSDLRNHAARTDRIGERLRGVHPNRRVPILRERAHEQHRRLRAAITHALERRQRDCTVARRALNAVNPLAVLDRGYAILFDDNGRTVRSAQGVAADAILEARLSDGILKLRHIPD